MRNECKLKISVARQKSAFLFSINTQNVLVLKKKEKDNTSLNIKYT